LRVCTTKTLAEFPVPTKSNLSQTLKDQSAAMYDGILLRYRLSGNSHPGCSKNLTLTCLRQVDIKILSYVES